MPIRRAKPEQLTVVYGQMQRLCGIGSSGTSNKSNLSYPDGFSVELLLVPVAFCGLPGIGHEIKTAFLRGQASTCTYANNRGFNLVLIVN